MLLRAYFRASKVSRISERKEVCCALGFSATLAFGLDELVFESWSLLELDEGSDLVCRKDDAENLRFGVGVHVWDCDCRPDWTW